MPDVPEKQFLDKMKNQVTFSHLISVITGILIPFGIWMANIHAKTQQIIINEQNIIKNEQMIETVKKEVREERAAREKVEKDILLLNTKILEKLHVIELKLENKQNRK